MPKWKKAKTRNVRIAEAFKKCSEGRPLTDVDVTHLRIALVLNRAAHIRKSLLDDLDADMARSDSGTFSEET